MAIKVLPGYETVWGNKKSAIIDYNGLKSYATGGDTFSAAQMGWGGFDVVEAVWSNQLTVNAVPTVVNATISTTYFVAVSIATTSAPGNAVAKVTVKWFVTSTGAEVGAGVDLSAEYVRLRLIGV